MKTLDFLYPALLVSSGFFSGVEAKKKPANAVLLSNIQSLTLRSGAKTSHRRVSAIPQLRCVGGNAQGLYEVDVMRCKNAGASYDDGNPDWTCTASLPAEFKLGSTDVICEGYDSPDDPYILKGSCGVEYRLVLTDAGYEKYGKQYGRNKNHAFHGYDADHAGHGDLVSKLFWMVFIGVALWILWAFVRALLEGNRQPGRTGGGTRRPGYYGGGGGGGGGDDDPPPPYDWRPGSKPSYSSGSTRNEGWRPGFWSGAAAGGAAGYAAGRAGNRAQTRYEAPSSSASSSRNSGGGGSSSPPSSARYESTGFGSTSRR